VHISNRTAVLIQTPFYMSNGRLLTQLCESFSTVSVHFMQITPCLSGANIISNSLTEKMKGKNRKSYFDRANNSQLNELTVTIKDTQQAV